jgi:type II secretory ATPase GspE/PulE/Tfp pilus assembly ATPase PilB-like protein
LARSDANAIEKVATDLGMRTMFWHGVELARRGETSLEEIMRVTRSAD